MAREIVLGTVHHFNWLNLGAALQHPEAGKGVDISTEVNRLQGIDDASVRILPNVGYGDAMQIRALIAQERPDAVMIFTDPRYWTWLFEIEREIRNEIPLLYLNIWDDYPAPLYNKSYYESCDLLMAISKQTKNINELVLEEKAKDKIITYVPHGINEKMFFPIKPDHEHYQALQEYKKNVFGGKEYEFVLFFNSRNIRRKCPGDLILAYRMFCDRIGKEAAKKCVLLMHTQPVDENGTDLYAVREAICDNSYVNVLFSDGRIDTAQLNLLYNICDANILISSNEGWGLSLTEAMMAGRMIIANTTGGMQDQMRFTDENGEWISFSSEFPSNHYGTYKDHGAWAVPVYPSNMSLVGSVQTPYILDDRADARDIASAIEYTYGLGTEERERRGVLAREWVTSDESGMSARQMCENVITSIDETFEKFKPSPRFELHKIVDRPKKYVQHVLEY